MKFSRLLTAVLLAAALGCDSPTAPRLESGTYVLADFAGHPLPALTRSEGLTEVYLLADTLRFDLVGNGTRTQYLRQVVSGDQPSEFQWSVTTQLDVTRQGGELRVSEFLICLADHVEENCTDRFNALAVVDGNTLTIGPRRYLRSGLAW